MGEETGLLARIATRTPEVVAVVRILTSAVATMTDCNARYV